MFFSLQQMMHLHANISLYLYWMKYIFLAMIILKCIAAFSQNNADYMIKMAADAGIKRPVSHIFASSIVRVPIQTDSISMLQWRKNYILRMQIGTGLLSGGVLLVVAHILVVAFVPNFNRNAVIATCPEIKFLLHPSRPDIHK